MKLLSGFVSLAILSATLVSSVPITGRDVDESLVPAGVTPTGTSLHQYELFLVADCISTQALVIVTLLSLLGAS
jgi:hypothetical protein